MKSRCHASVAASDIPAGDAEKKIVECLKAEGREDLL